MKTITFMTSLLTFYLKGEIKHEKNFIKLKIPNTFLTLIPLGANKSSVAINQIASVSTDFRLDFKHFLFGLVLAIIGFALMSKSFVIALVFLLFGAGVIINSMPTVLTITETSGKSTYLFFLIFEKAKAYEAEDAINLLISQRLDDTNVRQHTENQTNQLVDAISSLKNS